MQGYECNMCRLINKAQYKTTWNYQMKFDMWNSRVWSRSIAFKFDGAGQLVNIQLFSTFSYQLLNINGMLVLPQIMENVIRTLVMKLLKHINEQAYMFKIYE